MAVLWTEGRGTALVERIMLPGEGPGPSGDIRALCRNVCPSHSRRIAELTRRIAAFLSGRDIGFDLSILRLDLCPPFQRRVLLAEYGIPRGSVSTYGRIARRTGHPGAARAVGTALAKNPFPIAIPCHRALHADLSLGGYQGGLAMKRRLLEMEGIRFDRAGRVVIDTIYY